MNFWENAEKIAREKGLKRGWKTPVMQQAGMNITLIAKQKKTNAPPNAKIIIAVAQYLGVTTDYLLTGDEGAKPAHPHIASAMDAMRDMTNKARPHFASAARAVADTAEDEQEPSAARLADMAQTAQRAAPKQLATKPRGVMLPVFHVYMDEKERPELRMADTPPKEEQRPRVGKRIPVFHAAAGNRIVFEDANEWREVLGDDIDPERHIVVYAHGSSMIEAGIPNRAPCLFVRAQEANSSDVALVELDGEATIKQVKKTANEIQLIYQDGTGRVDRISGADRNRVRILARFVRVLG